MKVTKLKISAFKKADFSGPAGSYTVLINPDSYQTETNIHYSDEAGLGAPDSELRFQYIPSGQVSFKLIFDGTNLIANAPKKLKGKSVTQQINALEKITRYEGEIHRPYYLKLTWGNFLFKGVLVSLVINYKLFKPNGDPLRAEGTATFKTSSLMQESFLKARKTSPDLTHEQLIRSGDRLPNLCQNIYEGTNYYIQVAKSNSLDHFRKLQPGQILEFPPLKK